MPSFSLKELILISLITLNFPNLFSQVLLDADGPGNTYELITSVLAPGYDPVEEPDCSHTTFGRHIDELYDTDLGINVFRFFMHATPDNDRCLNFDRQRNEIKSYDQSPDNLLGVEDEIVQYKWKFKIDAGFQVSPNFTHLHQLKSVGGSLDGMPMYTLTARKATPDRLELRYAETDTQITLQQTDLAPFKGTWLEVTETISYGTSGTYAIEIKKVNDGSILFNYSNSNIINWRSGASFVRPKWGIYRSLNNVADLRDEEVLFANFSIEEQSSLSINEFNTNTNSISISPNPANNKVAIEETLPGSFNSISVYDLLGRKINLNFPIENNTMDISYLQSGQYVIVFKKDSIITSINKLLVE